MNKPIMLALFIMVFASLQVVAAQNNKPYAGQQDRHIKALSESEVDGLLKGKGMGMAKPAELNKYPGPKHVLEIAEKLDLSHDQLLATMALFKKMKSEAIPLGKEIVAAEKRLDELFASGVVTNQSLAKVLDEIAVFRSKLRFVHLKTHLLQKNIMTKMQIHQYNRFRGYAKHHHH